MLELQALAVKLGDFRAEFSFHVADREWIAVIGPSGSGKTTLLNLIGGFVRPQSGRILVDGRDTTRLPPAERPVTTLFQEHNLFAHLTVADNVGLGIDPGLSLDAAQRHARDDALEAVGMAGHGADKPGTLSGGERQRVGLARALVRNRPILLLDEPLGQLDPALRRDMLELIQGLRHRRGLTILMVLHTPEEAAAHVERYAFVEGGRIAAAFSAAEFRAGDVPDPVRRYLG